MTTSSVTPRVKYNGSGSTGPFSIPFRYDASSELIVTKTSSAGVESTLTVTTHFTLGGSGPASTGTLTLLTTLAVGETLTIERSIAQTQTVDLEVSYVNPEILEGALDKLTRGIQDAMYQIGRTLRLYKDDTTGSGVYNAGGQKIGNVAEGVNDTDVAIMSQLNEIAGSASDAAASAAAAAASAATAQSLADLIGDAISGSVISFEGRTGLVTAQAGDYTASEITNVPSGNLAAVTVQAALNELQSDIDGRQAIDAELTAIAGLVSAANKLPYFTGSGTAALTDLTAFARTLLDDSTASDVRMTLGVTIGSDVQAYDANLADYATNVSAFIQTLIDDADAATARATLGLGDAALADTADFQAADATLDGLAAYNTNGILTQTAADTFVGRSVAAGSGIAVTNGDGVSGNPTVAMDINSLTNRTAFASGCKIPIYEPGVGIRKVDYDDLPSGGGGGLANAYKDVTDGTTTASASGADTFKVRAGTGLTVTVGSNDVTHGDNILYELDATLSALAGITTGADKLPYLTGTDTWSTTDLTAFARTFLDDADAAAVQTTLGLRPGVEVQAYDAELAALAGLTSAADKVPYFTGAGTAGVTDFTSVARTLVNQTTQALMRTTGLGMSANGSSLVSAADYAAMKTLLGLSTADSPQFTGLEIGHASDTTLTRASAGELNVEGNRIYRAGGTDVALADGGTGASLTDPNADRILFWDDSLGAMTWLTLGTNLSITGTTIDASGGFPSGTLMLFQQTSAPTGWTKQTTHNNKALRVVSGTASSGGSVAFTTAFASQAVSGTVGNFTLTTNEIPAHNHTPQGYATGSGGAVNLNRNTANTTLGNFALTTSNTGGGAAHNHSFTGTPIDLAVQYVDLIIASKD